MKKDVIYIDVDDDVTAIIGKLKKSKEKVVALVPPKRAGALQSAVNLRLIDRMAKAEKKHLVLITNNQALMALAASSKIPVAKNLQSKPEIAEVPALIVDDGDDIIDGANLPVGDHAGTLAVHDATRESRSDAIDEVEINLDDMDAPKKPKEAEPKGKKGPTIPNFDLFRKKFLLGAVGVAAFVALLVWMFGFAPSATIVITARTTPVPVSTNITLGGTTATNQKEGVINSISMKEEKEEVVEFEATGQENLGNKASGTLEIKRLSQTDYAVPAGTRFSASGRVFLTTEAVTIPASVPCFPTYCAQSVDVNVQAEKPGEEYNGISGSASNSDGIQGTFQGATSGGTTRMARVVSSEDIERARGKLVGESSDEQKEAMIAKLTGGEKVVDGSFAVERGKPVSEPAAGKEAEDNKATLTVKTTYTIQAIAKTELETFLKSYIETVLGENTSQQIFDTGVNEATVGNFAKDGNKLTATVNATGRTGPRIDEAAVIEESKGKIYGEVQSTLQAREGIKEVDVRFSYFWVRTVPGDVNKISVEYKVEDE